MNMVRKIEAWEAKDGTVHTTERKALIASITHVINSNLSPSAVNFDERSTLAIEKSLPELMPLFTRLMDPRNAERPAPPIVASPAQAEPPMDMTFVDDALETAVTVATDLDPSDIRVGQLVELKAMDDGRPVQMIIQSFDEAWPMADANVSGRLIIDGVPFGGELDSASAAFDDIIKVIQQPEERMDLVEVRAELKRLSNEEEASDYDAATVASMHKRRILLLRREDQLCNGEAE